MDYYRSIALDLELSEPQATDSLKELAYHRLEDKIVRLEFKPGIFVTERELAESISIGRTPVREAIQHLATAGLLSVLPRRGIKVSEVDALSVLRLLEVSRSLDTSVATAAASRATSMQRHEFSRLAEEFDSVSSSNDSVAQIRLDSEFNNLCMLAMGNEHARKMCRLIQPLTRRFWFAHHGASTDIGLAPRLHSQAAKALAQGDAEGASAAFNRINNWFETFVYSTIQE